jgi:hypothetical protein
MTAMNHPLNWLVILFLIIHSVVSFLKFNMGQEMLNSLEFPGQRPEDPCLSLEGEMATLDKMMTGRTRMVSLNAS